MTTTEQSRVPFAFAVPPGQAQRAWEQAIRSSALVSLTARTPEELELRGSLDSATAGSLWIATPSAGVEPPLPSICCDAVLELGDARYLFETNILATRDERGRRLLEIARPEWLHVIQRRRFWRAKLQGSSLVRLSRITGDPSQGAPAWSCIGSMLNASMDGLACRTERTAADALAVGEALRAAFSLAGHDQPFAVDAIVKSKIPAGTAGQVVLGLQFKHAHEEQRKRLQAALAYYS